MFLYEKKLLALRAVLGPALLPARHPAGVQRAAHDVVAHAGKVLHAAPADEHDRVLLQVVALARDVGSHLNAVREPHTRDLAERGVRLLRRRRVDARADAALLRARLQRRRTRLALLWPPPMPDELAQSGHSQTPEIFLTAGNPLGHAGCGHGIE